MAFIQSDKYVFLALYPARRDGESQNRMIAFRELLRNAEIDFQSTDPAFLFIDAKREDDALSLARENGFRSARTPVPELRFNGDLTVYEPARNPLMLAAAILSGALIFMATR